MLNPSVNLEFNAHFLDTALSCGARIVKCPITFHRRVGLSKGGNTNNRRALKVGLSNDRRDSLLMEVSIGAPNDQGLPPGALGIRCVLKDRHHTLI